MYSHAKQELGTSTRWEADRRPNPRSHGAASAAFRACTRTQQSELVGHVAASQVWMVF